MRGELFTMDEELEKQKRRDYNNAYYQRKKSEPEYRAKLLATAKKTRESQKYKERMAAYNEANKETIKASKSKQFKEKYADPKFKQKLDEERKKRAESLSDSYIIQLIVNKGKIKRCDITPEMIIEKRRFVVEWKKKEFFIWNGVNKNSGGGVYEIVNTITGERYVGSTSHLYNRIRTHRSKLIKGEHPSSLLQDNVSKYGIANFNFNVLEFIPDNNALISREQHFLDTLQCDLNFYKVAGSPKGHKPRPETLLKMSEMRRGRSFNKGQVPWNKGLNGIIKLSEESKRKIRDSNKNNKLSIELARKIREEGKDGKVTQKQLGEKYSVSGQIVGQILLNKMWKE